MKLFQNMYGTDAARALGLGSVGPLDLSRGNVQGSTQASLDEQQRQLELERQRLQLQEQKLMLQQLQLEQQYAAVGLARLRTANASSPGGTALIFPSTPDPLQSNISTTPTSLLSTSNTLSQGALSSLSNVRVRGLPSTLNAHGSNLGATSASTLPSTSPLHIDSAATVLSQTCGAIGASNQIPQVTGFAEAQTSAPPDPLLLDFSNRLRFQNDPTQSSVSMPLSSAPVASKCPTPLSLPQDNVPMIGTLLPTDHTADHVATNSLHSSTHAQSISPKHGALILWMSSLLLHLF